MNLLPVIERELRAEARHPGTQWLRPLSAGMALVLSAILLMWEKPALRPGPELFAQLHHTLLVTIWLLVPIMTADCISREKREQTLGLLFLTPLRAWEILFSKVLAHGLRAATICVAVLPVALLPILIGGIPVSTIFTALMANAGAFVWALAAGILASVLSRSLLGALGWALLLALLFLVGHGLLNGIGLHLAIAATGRGTPTTVGLVGVGLLALWNPELVLDGAFRLMPPSARLNWFIAGSGVAVASGLGLVSIGWLGAWRLRNAWQEWPPSPRRARLAQTFSRPRFAPRFYRTLMRHRLERNPVGWLERRRWTSRAAVWIWIGVLALVQTALLAFDDVLGDADNMDLLGVALIGTVAIVAAASLRRERETGVLELLLTTPLEPRQIVAGLLRGIWLQFLPAVVLYGVGMFAIQSQSLRLWITDVERGDSITKLVTVGIFFVTVPIGGLWLSLRTRHYLSGLFWTVVLLGVIPFLLAWRFDWVWNDFAGARRGPLMVPLLAGLLLACLSLGVVGVRELRVTIGRTLALMMGAWLLLTLLLVIREEFAAFGQSRRWVRVHTAQLTLPCFLLFGAGWAQRLLLRDLGVRSGNRSSAVSRTGSQRIASAAPPA